MQRTVLSAVALVLVTGQALQTDYTQERSLRIEIETSISMETTNFTAERDGEPMDIGGGGGAGSKEETRSVVIDTVLAHTDGAPTHVRRVFEDLSSKSERTFRDESNESESDCPLSGVTVEISIDEDGETAVEVVDGDEPDDEAGLQKHRATLALDALLPVDGAGVADSWDVDAAAIRRALGIDVRRSLYPRPQREEGEREEGGRGRGRRGSSNRGGGTGALFGLAEWEGEATLASDDDEYQGEKFTAGGDMPEPERGEGARGGRRGRMPVETLTLASALSRAPQESEYEIEIEGRVYYSTEEGRPLGAEFEGTLAIDQRTERSRGDSTMTMNITREGTYERTVTIEAVAPDDGND
jgi:hypothetical protein